MEFVCPNSTPVIRAANVRAELDAFELVEGRDLASIDLGPLLTCTLTVRDFGPTLRKAS